MGVSYSVTRIATNAIGCVLCLLLASNVWAHWKPQYADSDPVIAKWFGAQHNAYGEWCCDKSDGHAYYGSYTFNKDGSVTLHLGQNNDRTLPAYMILQGPNPTGHAVWWYAESNVSHRDYCFAPGTLM